MDETKPVVAYSDGSCRTNPGRGGWAWIAADGRYGSGPAKGTTNQRMEIKAAYEAVKSLHGSSPAIEVVTDSKYVVDCFEKKWWVNWQRNGWLNAKKESVANRDLWEPFINLVNEHGNVSFRWVKGHSGNRMNDEVDALAKYAASAQRELSGESFENMIRSMSKSVRAQKKKRKKKARLH